MAYSEIQLPCGLIDTEGKVHNKAVIKEMTARVKKELASKKIRSEPFLAQEMLLENCIDSINDNKNITSDLLGNLLSADRDYLMFEIRKLSLGSDIKGRTICSNQDCLKEQGVSMDLDADFDVYQIPEDVELRKDAKNNPYRVFTVEIPDEDVKLVFRYDRGFDRKKIFKTLDNNPIEGKMQLMGICLVEANINGEETKGPVGAYFFEIMSLKLWEEISYQWDANLPGIDTAIMVPCIECENENLWELDPLAFFTPEKPEKKRRLGKLMPKSGQ